MSNLLKKDKGFTLIEIVLVMAIAGLILVIVFLAVQGAQRARRDQQRKTDASRMLSAVEQCASNNQGDYTQCTGTAAKVNTSLGYFSPNQAPGGGTYTAAPSPTAPTNTQFEVLTTFTCPGASTASPVAVEVLLEQGASTFCVGN